MPELSENTCFSIHAAGSANSGKVTIELEYGRALATIDKKLDVFVLTKPYE